MGVKKTIVGSVDPAVLSFTAGEDTVLDLQLAEADCIGSAAHVTMPAPAAPGGPGPFSFAEAPHAQAILEAAGFREIEHTSVACALSLGADIEAATRLCLQMGPAASALRLASERGEDVDRDAIRDAIAAALAPFASSDGVHIPSASWVVQARA